MLTDTAWSAPDRCDTNSTFNIGAGVYDITGPAAEEGMMGYAMIQQKTAGLLQRLWARAFVIESPCNGKRIVFVNVDLGHVFQAVRQAVIQQLQKKYGNIYNDQNVLLTAIHTHSGPGGYSTYNLYNLTVFGFDRNHFNAMVNGIVAAIERAQMNMQPANIFFASGDLPGINFNRSPQAYLLNPAEERAQYQGNTDITMTLIRFNNATTGNPIGLINWFPIHGVSMNNKNHLINGDNKGYAEYLFEKDFHSDYGPHAFVAAFAQEHAGDVSPNPYGHEGGEGALGITAVEKAGYPQYVKAKELFDTANTAVTGPVDYRQTFIKMDDVSIDPVYTNGQPQHTCPAAIGISMLAGTQDGEGVGVQGVTCDTISKNLPHFICEKITTPCQGAKPIALQTGLQKPYPWTPNILPLQIIKIGNLIIIAIPTEVTTMSGRRIMNAVAAQFPPNQYHFVLSALANAYSGYLATPDEYPMQRYEAASTHFGPWELAAFEQEFTKLAQAMIHNQSVPSGSAPPDLLNDQINLQPGVVLDDVPPKKQFGDIYHDVKSNYYPGDTVQAIFWGAHPKNNYRDQDTFLKIEQLINGSWQSIRYDRDWDTEYHWQRNGAAYSLVTIVWRIPKTISPGQYRIVHYGDWKSGWTGNIYPYTGYSSIFMIKNSSIN
jgi:neutral ceramidase